MKKRHVLMAMLLVASMGAAAAASGKNDRMKLGESPHLALEPLTVTVFRDSRARGLLSIDLTLQMAKASAKPDVEKIMPRLRDQLVLTLTRLAANRVDVDRPLDLDAMGKALQAATDRTLGEGQARVLISGATVRRL